MTSSPRRARAATAGLTLLAVALVPALQQVPADAAGTSTVDAPGLKPPPSITTIGDTVAGLPDLTAPVDASGRKVAVKPTAAQLSAADVLGSRVEVTWNASGTPASIFAWDGVLARSSGTAVDTAETYVRDNRVLLGLSDAQVSDFDANVELVSEQPFADSTAKAVLFRQKFGDLVAATRSMVTVGIAANGDVAYVSSSLTKAAGAAPRAALTPLAGWLKAAASVQRGVTATDLPRITSRVSEGWTRLRVPGLDQPQLARLRALGMPDGTVRPVIEANVVDVKGGSSLAYRVLVDGVSGTVLFRQNAVENSNDAFPFQGAYTPLACGPVHPFAVGGGTQSIAVIAAAVVASDDITIKLFDDNQTLIGDFDLGTSPETATYSPGGVLPVGTYGMQVCAFDPMQTGGPYTATVVTSDTGTGGTGGGALPNPRWRAFGANPPLTTIAQPAGFSPDNSLIECWFAGTAGCSDGEVQENVASFGPWDQLNGAPSFTTIGNNANTHEAWASFLTPGGAAQAPISPTRDYTEKFTDVWNNSGCGLDNFTPGGNDINAVTGNLFTGHNRIHDFAYSLGFTERNYNLQLANQGRGGAGNDPEIGNVQAGAASGGAAGMYMGRNNANQIALQDGVPGITNQYLFQPIAGAFYSPCTDGSLDTGIYGHEYTHATSNRMVGGPDDGLTSEQGGAMGESWSDLVAAEYQFENDYALGALADGSTANPWSLGSYTTGNFDKGIRDYAINNNPLNYSDYGFDTTGAEVHADGEIWNGTLWEVRQALVNKYDGQFRYTDKGLQDLCADPSADPTGQPAAASCPGNRRWLQLIFDAWLLQSGATDMLQARNAMLAADWMRFGGANQDLIASAFARRGMGADAFTPDADSEDVVPSFRSASGNNSAVTFTSTSAGKVYVGSYEARVTPVADTATRESATATFTPGVYRMTFVSPTNGFRRFILTVPDNGIAFRQPIDDAAANVAGFERGARVITGATTAGSRNAVSLIDGTETSNWAGVTPAHVDESTPGVAVSLAGGLQTISSAKVSALLRPAPADPDALPLLADGSRLDDDPDAGSRFTALRQFALQACTTGCEDPANYTTFYTSPADAFPGDIPRPVAPDQTLRTFRFSPVQAAAVRLVALENQCTGQARYAGEQDNDPSNSTDCKTNTDRGTIVHAAELQVFADSIPDDPAEASFGSGARGSGTAGQGTNALPLAGQASLVNPGPAAVRSPGRTKTRIRPARVQ
ncbi:MAG: M36 family metallopeptidase [Nocardioides sp.]|nr:M36 family metallopeptidase [Nocardioides sp.]